jgi:hypothetical protein
MFLTRKSLLLAVLGCAGIASAAAQGVPQTILDCVDLKRDAARLTCFDREVATLTQRSAGVASTPTPLAPPAQTATPVVPAPQVAAPAKQDDFGLSGELARKRAEAKPKEDKPLEEIKATVTNVTKRPYGELMFELDNGQVWQQPEKKTNFEIKAGEHVRVTKGALGSFFLVADSGASTRVKRVR